MYGREYLDWTDKQIASDAVDAFLAAMPAHERKWALAVLRERFEVRVEYRDSLQHAMLQNLNRQNQLQRGVSSHLGSTGSVLGRLFD